MLSVDFLHYRRNQYFVLVTISGVNNSFSFGHKSIDQVKHVDVLALIQFLYPP